MAQPLVDEKQEEELIQCPICLEHCKDPRMLPWSHTFCLECIEQVAAHNNDQFMCPFRDGI